MKTMEEKLARRARKKAGREAALAKGHPYRVGQLYSNSWGYEQTNVDMYEVVAVTARTVTLRPIASHAVPDTRRANDMAQMVGPSPGQFTGPAFTRTLQVWVNPFTGEHGEPYVPMKYGSLHLMNPEDTTYESWYG